MGDKKMEMMIKWWHHLQDNFDNNSEYGHQQYDQEKDVESG